MSSVGRTWLLAGLAASVLSVSTPGLRAENEPAVARGVQFLKERAAGLGFGEMALAALGMIKAEVPPSDPKLSACLATISSHFTSEGFQSETQSGPDIYTAAVVAMVLSNLDSESRRGELDKVASYLMGKQKSNGSWDYENRTLGDSSISQYAVLGLWEASNGGADVPPTVFDRAARWFMSTQGDDGGWTYHHDAGTPPTISMTAAGVGSLLICQRQLRLYREMIRGDAPSKLLIPLTPVRANARTDYELENSPARIEPAVKRGISWLASTFTTTNGANFGQSIYYGLYGIERIGALADRNSLGRIDWFEQGRRFILSGQGAGGSWSSTYGEGPNTVWAILFLTRSTAKSLARIEIKRLGAGTLLGGRGLPKDLSSLTVAGGRVVSRPLNGAVEGMLSVLEDPRAENADSALSGLVARYQTGGPAVLRPHKDRFRKLLSDRDPGLRQLAAWALGRTGDLDVVPDLIDVLVDSDPSVVETARLGLQLLSRKIEGPGPAQGGSLEQRQEAARQWRDWYRRSRPLDLEGEDDAPRPSDPNAGRRR
jgi:hypothetical protein